MNKPNHRSLSVIADEIYSDHRTQGKKLNYAAVPYVDALASLDQVTENYICDTGSSVVAYALSNLSTWKGEKAREIKKELNAILKNSK